MYQANALFTYIFQQDKKYSGEYFVYAPAVAERAVWEERTA